jgi:hypothetical protein
MRLSLRRAPPAQQTSAAICGQDHTVHMSRPAAGGGRWVDVGAERLAGWLARFAAEHGPVETTASATTVELRGADGTTAACEVPFAPLHPGEDPVAALVAHVCRDRVVGVLLVRLGGYAAGVFRGSELVASKVGSRQVHGRSAAGGQSQQRFARRRDNQATAALGKATDNAAAVLLPHLGSLDAVVTGGDRTALRTVLADRRLTALTPLVEDRVLDVPDPRQAVLLSTPPRFRAVRVHLTDPDG